MPQGSVRWGLRLLALRRYRPHLVGGLFLLLILTGLGGYVYIWPGTTVCGHRMDWLTVGEAREFLSGELDWPNRSVVFRGEDNQLTVLWEDLGITADVKATVDSCRRSLWARLIRKDVPLSLSCDEETLRVFCDRLNASWKTPGSDAKFHAEGDGVRVVPHEKGTEVDVPVLLSSLTRLRKLWDVTEEIQVPMKEVLPAILYGDLQSFMPLEVIASYTTFFQDGNDRAFNISLACAYLGEVTLMPGETFSFNDAVGPRSKERGYKKAGVIFGDRLIDDYGGGVCQVSTGLYVALLKAGLSVEERHNHGIPVSYVPLGMDATVAFGSLDLKVKNTLDFPVLLLAEVENGAITARVYGGRESGLDIVIESKVVEKIPPKEEPKKDGEEGGEEVPLRSGYLVETVRKYVKDGLVVKTERVNLSTYPPERRKPSR